MVSVLTLIYILGFDIPKSELVLFEIWNIFISFPREEGNWLNKYNNWNIFFISNLANEKKNIFTKTEQINKKI